MSPRRLGLLTMAVSFCADQANKLWLIYVYGIEARQPLQVNSYFDIIFAKNPGISYSLFPARTALQRASLLLFIFAATMLLAAWLWKVRTRIAGCGLGLIVGGALGNFYDRLAYGFVADFYSFHVGSFQWYVFNLADVSIVLGAALLIYDSLFQEKKRSRSGQTAGE
jgi:signal peptidase II